MTDDDGNAFRRNGEAWMNWTDLARGVMYAVELILCVKVLGDRMMPTCRHGPDPWTACCGMDSDGVVRVRRGQEPDVPAVRVG